MGKVTTRIVKVDCPFKKCNHQLQGEVNAEWDSMSQQEQDTLMAQVRNRLLPGLKKHHKDGHPKE